MGPQDIPVILHNDKRGLLVLEDDILQVLQLSRDGNPPKRLLSCPIRYLLRVSLAKGESGTRRRLDLSSVIRKGRTCHLSQIHVLVEPINVPEAEEWVEAVMLAAYRGAKPFREILLLVNPIGGKGKSESIVRHTVLPILQAAGCTVDLRETTHRLHAEEIAQQINLEYDVIATASGDGLVYEVLNGLAARSDARKALKTPVVPIPTGSANALCVNLLGPEDYDLVPIACLNIIKGQPLPMDLCSVLLLPSMTRRWSFLATAMGLMVDLDIGTEHLRWMGNSRFIYGYLRGLISQKKLSCRIRMKIVASDKVEMAREARQTVRSTQSVGGGIDPISPTNVYIPSKPTSKEMSNIDGSLPAPIELKPDESWKTIESTGTHLKTHKKGQNGKGANNDWVDGEGIIYVYCGAGSVRWPDKSLLQWPVATPGAVSMDMVIQAVMSRGAMATSMSAAEIGETYWAEEQHYYKVTAFIAENSDKPKQPSFTIDGEAFPFDTFQVELHPRLATTMSLDGNWYIPEFLKKNNPI
ncbi:hypothetical protein TREMEDRAFT_67509 [Tremella mesenterica DSM 1558]|uniref:uncharacterized protein n=1 Tax=Tremella mesenterica (strain ATCC 24925 / CBS 8224 / DSM 1558 / NBRC 9311 / NRRL Y-6157 / RJB 2259-6 / UBC 559-6) TaxID=578456 RepID=UPI0003F4A639|nr:uncharacterized protein TREMEDRAFT_67509 [Tremella mesenterica DSM 1558]EIW73704.1 hypothetical protein TREMEDRAFT_67509 [Tremella mesenterica DSM 1558]